MGAGLTRPGWRTVAAAVAGRSHQLRGEPCGDVCGVRRFPLQAGNELLVAVVSDGAGSSERGRDGAWLACESLLDVAAGWAARQPDLLCLDDEAIRGWVEHVGDRLTGAALAELRQPRDYAATLVAALVDEARAVFLQLGDGAIVHRRAAGEWRAATWPQTGEYANETFFVTDPRAGAIVEVASAGRVDELALFSDGLQSLALRLAEREPHAPFFEPMFRRLRDCAAEDASLLEERLRAFLDGEAVNARTEDDKALVLATRLAAGA